MFNVDDGDDGTACAGLIHEIALGSVNREVLVVRIDRQRVRIFATINIGNVVSGAHIVGYCVSSCSSVDSDLIVACAGIYI